MLWLTSADFFQNQLFEKKIQEHYQSANQFGSRSGPYVQSVLIWVQTVCKNYQHTIKVAASKERVKPAWKAI